MAWYNPFSWGKQKKEQQGPAAQFLKRTAPYQTKPGALAYERYKRQLEGLDVGIPESVLEETRGPIAAPYRYGTARALETAAAARSRAGMGKSSLAGAQAGDIALRGEQTIADKLARLRLANEEMKRREMGTALGGLERFGTGAAVSSAEEKALSVSEFERQQGLREGEIDRQNQEAAQLQALVGTVYGGAVGMPQLGQIALGNKTTGIGGDLTKMTIADILREAQDEMGAAKQIAGRTSVPIVNRMFGLPYTKRGQYGGVLGMRGQ